MTSSKLPHPRPSTLVRAPPACLPPPGSKALEKQLRRRLRSVTPVDGSIKSRLVYNASSWIDKVRGLPKRVIRLPKAPAPSRAASLVVPLIFVTSEEDLSVEYKPIARRQRVRTVKAKNGAPLAPRVQYSWQWNPEADVPTDLSDAAAAPDDAHSAHLLDAIAEEPDVGERVVDVKERMRDMDALVAALRAQMAAEADAADDDDDDRASIDTVRCGPPPLVADDGASPALGASQDTMLGEDEFQTAQEDGDGDVVAEQAVLIKSLSKLWEDLDEDEMCLEMQKALAAVSGEDA